MSAQPSPVPHDVEYLLRIADDRLILGHRLSEWCAHGPILEEDIALANIALDYLGQAKSVLELAGEREGEGRDADKLAYFRGDREFRNCLLVEQPNGDFGDTIARQFLFDIYDVLYTDALQQSSDIKLAGIAGKAHKEAMYHARHSREWMLRLGDGTAESHQRIQRSLDALWMFTGELFDVDEIDRAAVDAGLGVDASKMHDEWSKIVCGVLKEATLDVPSDDVFMRRGGRSGRHSEHLGPLLAEMQFLARSHPEAAW